MRVFGGEFKVTLSAATASQRVVLNAHGTPLTAESLDMNFNDIDVAHALQAAHVSSDIRRSIQTYVVSSRVAIEDTAVVDADDVELSATHPVELVWYPLHTHSHTHAGQSTEVALAHYVKGTVTTAGGNFVSFYAFVEVGTESVLKLVQLNDDEHLSGVATSTGAAPDSIKGEGTSLTSSAVPPSPFASPISDASIYCYDQYMKDYNDG